jgi:hypothetical protein
VPVISVQRYDGEMLTPAEIIEALSGNDEVRSPNDD